MSPTIMTVLFKTPVHAPVGLNSKITGVEESRVRSCRITLCHFPSVHFKKQGKAEVAFCSVCRVYKGRGSDSCLYESQTHKTLHGHPSPRI